MADDWYYAQNNQQLGPVPLESLRAMASAGQLQPADLVWTNGMAQWIPARSVPEIGSIFLHANAAAGPGSGAAGAGGPGTYGVGASPAAYGAAPGSVPGTAPGQLQYGVSPSYYNQQYAGAEYAGFWLRFCAMFIDGIIIGIPFFILAFVVEMAFPSTTNPRTGMQTPSGAGVAASLVINLLQIVVYWLYFAMQESGPHQATLGKRAVGIKVTGLNGEPISFANATGRHFAKIISGCIIYIGFIMAAFTERKQGLHDMMAGTLVVKKGAA